MTLDELKALTDKKIGLVSKVEDERSSGVTEWATLCYYSPNTTLLFWLDVYSLDGKWRVEGKSLALPDMGNELRRLK